MYASAPIGALQPPSSFFKKRRSILVDISVSLWLSGTQASRASVFDFRVATIIAPCAGAGTIHSRFTESSGVNPRRPKPAAAKIAPFQSLFFSFCKRVLTFPRIPTVVWVGYLFNHWA